MAYTDQDKQKWLEIAQDTGSSIERGAPVLTLGELDTTVSIPGVKFSSISYDEEGNVTWFGTPESYAQLPLGTLAIKTKAAQDAADAANTAAARANTASDGAEKVDASLVGMTVTITDRKGVSRSVNIGFEIYKVYGSVAAMKADAANVPNGAFVMIATADPISTENAQLWARNAEPATSANPFTFLSDLDQAATHVWDDWNTNLRQAIVDATQDAIDAAALANTKAAIAQTAADNADTSRLAIEANERTRQQNETTRQQNEQGRVAAESQRVTDWNGFWGTSETDPNGVRKQWADLQSQAESDHDTATSDHTTATQDHTTATQDHSTATHDHSTATHDHSTAVSDHNIATQDHTTAQADHSNYTADRQTFATDEAERQQTFETNESQRQQDFEDAEADRMAAMVVTRCFVDTTTMCLMFIQPEKDSTQYKVRNGNLNIVITYDE